MASFDKKLESSILIVAEVLFWVSGLAAILYFWKDIQGGVKAIFVSGNPMLLFMFILPLGAIFFKSGNFKGAFKNFLSMLRIYFSILLVLFFLLILFKK